MLPFGSRLTRSRSIGVQILRTPDPQHAADGDEQRHPDERGLQARPVADVAEDIQKQNDDFKKYFADEPAESAGAGRAAELKAEPKVADNDFDKFFARPDTESSQP